MQAVILAGGLGTRLELLTKKVAKVMLMFSGKPFIVHLLGLLAESGISEIVLCIGYLGEQVKDYLGGGRAFGMNVSYSEEKEQLLGTGGALKQAQNLLSEQFFVINGDTYLPIDYEKVQQSFLNRRKRALMVAYNNEEKTGVRNNIEIDGKSMVIRYSKERSDLSLKYVESGVLVVKREVLDIIPDERLFL